MIFALVMVMAWTQRFAESFNMISFSRGFAASARMEEGVFAFLGTTIALMTFVLGTGWMQRFTEGFVTWTRSFEALVMTGWIGGFVLVLALFRTAHFAPISFQEYPLGS